MAMTTDYLPTHQSLLNRLKDLSDETGWKRFFDTYWRIIYDVARKAGLTDAEAQDIVQETIIGVARRIAEFRYDPKVCSFKTWLLQMTRWRIIDHLRKRQYQSQGRRLPREERLETRVLEHQPDVTACDLEAIWDEEWRRNLMNSAIEKIKRSVSPGLYQMFHLHVIKKYPVKTVAERLGVKAAEVYFAKYKVSALLKREIKALENTPI